MIELVAGGKTLKALCVPEDAPAESSMRALIAGDEELSAHYARARVLQFSSWADELVEISEDTEKAVDDRRLRIQTKQWMMSRSVGRAEWGDKPMVENNVTVPVIINREDADL